MEYACSQKDINWNTISKFFKNKTAKQCSYRFSRLQNDKLIRRKWDKEDDLRLVGLVDELGHDWLRISIRMNERSIQEVQERYEKIFKKSKKKKGKSFNRNKINILKESPFKEDNNEILIKEGKKGNINKFKFI